MLMCTVCLIYHTEISVKDLVFYIRVGLGLSQPCKSLPYQEIIARCTVLLKVNYFLLRFCLQE